MPLDINGYSANFSQFVKFAQGSLATKTGKSTVAKLETSQLGDRTVGSLKANKNDGVGNWLRNSDKMAANDRVRDLFKASVADMFGGEAKIPAGVKKAMEMEHFGVGKPLTARRILAVKAAIDADGGAAAAAVREKHGNAAEGSDEHAVFAAGGRFAANEAGFQKGMALLPLAGNAMKSFSKADRAAIGDNLRDVGLPNAGPKATAFIRDFLLASVAHDKGADPDSGAALFSKEGNAGFRLLSLQYEGKGAMKAIAGLAPAQRNALAKILERFMEKNADSVPADGKKIVHSAFVKALAANIDKLAALDAKGKLDSKTLARYCCPGGDKSELGGAIFADAGLLAENKAIHVTINRGGYYAFKGDAAELTGTMDEIAQSLQERLGTAFVPEGYDLRDLARGAELADAVEDGIAQASAENRRFDAVDFRPKAEDLMLKTAIRTRVGAKIEALLKERGAAGSGTTLAIAMLARNPAVFDGIRAAKDPAEAEAAFEALDAEIRGMVDLHCSLEALGDETARLLETLLGEQFGVPAEDVRNQFKCFGRLGSKISALQDDIRRGKFEGCREPGFEAKPYFDKIASDFVREYVSKTDELDALPGVSDAIKANWRIEIRQQGKPSEFDMGALARAVSKIDVDAFLAEMRRPGAGDAERTAAVRNLLQGVEDAMCENVPGWIGGGADEKGGMANFVLSALGVEKPAFKALIAEMDAHPETNLFVTQAEGFTPELQYIAKQLHQLSLET